jgi:hypothetical protein
MRDTVTSPRFSSRDVNVICPSRPIFCLQSPLFRPRGENNVGLGRGVEIHVLYCTYTTLNTGEPFGQDLACLSMGPTTTAACSDPSSIHPSIAGSLLFSPSSHCQRQSETTHTDIHTLCEWGSMSPSPPLACFAQAQQATVGK